MILRTGSTHRPQFVVPQPLKEEAMPSCKILPEPTVSEPEFGLIMFLRNFGSKLPDDTTLQSLKGGNIFLRIFHNFLIYSPV
jgi:hypothetical protein